MDLQIAEGVAWRWKRLRWLQAQKKCRTTWRAFAYQQASQSAQIFKILVSA